MRLTNGYFISDQFESRLGLLWSFILITSVYFQIKESMFTTIVHLSKYFFSFIFISWRLITLQYCSGFCHTLTWISHGFTCVPHLDPPPPPPSSAHPSGSSQCTSPEHLSHAFSLGWWSVSHLIIYMSQCYSLRLSHPCLLPQTPTNKIKWKKKSFALFVVQLLIHVWLCNLMDYSTPGFPVLHYLLEFGQTHVHWVSDAIQLSHFLSFPSPLALNLSKHQGLFQWVGSSYKVAKVLELQLQHQSFQWKIYT